MSDEAKVTLGSAGPEGWEGEEKISYDAEALRKEYRQRLYSDRGLKVLDERETLQRSSESPHSISLRSSAPLSK